MQGIITDIQRFSVYDGPGIRTTVFLKGCPLRCAWCHNPECISPHVQPRVSEKRCTRCGACVSACPPGAHGIRQGVHTLDTARCRWCGACEQACAYGAITRCGDMVTPEQVMEIVRRDARYYRHGEGGVTISGGEPLMQPDFTLALLTRCREEGIHTCVETCGQADYSVLQAVARSASLILYDYKETDPERHARYTGVSNVRILQNLHALLQEGVRLRLRCPIIPGYNDREAHIRGIGSLAHMHPGIEGIELMAYHAMGRFKYAELGMPCGAEPVREMDAQEKARILAAACSAAGREVIWG